MLYQVKQLNNYLIKMTVTCTPSLTSLSYATAFHTGLLASLSAANVFPFKPLPAQPLLPIANGS